MSDTVRLTNGSTPIDFSPSEGYDKPSDADIRRHSAVSGKAYSYKFNGKKRWNVPVQYFTKADADIINGWWNGLTLLTFTPDLINAPSTTYSVRIHNQTDPLATFRRPSWEDKYSGTIILREQ